MRKAEEQMGTCYLRFVLESFEEEKQDPWEAIGKSAFQLEAKQMSWMYVRGINHL